MPHYRVLLEVEVNAKTPIHAVRKIIRQSFAGNPGTIVLDIPAWAEVRGGGDVETVDVLNNVEDLGVL